MSDPLCYRYTRRAHLNQTGQRVSCWQQDMSPSLSIQGLVDCLGFLSHVPPQHLSPQLTPTVTSTRNMPEASVGLKTSAGTRPE